MANVARASRAGCGVVRSGDSPAADPVNGSRPNSAQGNIPEHVRIELTRASGMDPARLYVAPHTGNLRSPFR